MTTSDELVASIAGMALGVAMIAAYMAAKEHLLRKVVRETLGVPTRIKKAPDTTPVYHDTGEPIV